MSPARSRYRALVGGIVAFQDSDRIARSIRSLLRQRLPIGASWRRIWVVVPAEDTETLAAAREVAAAEPVVVVVEETRRRGKSAALGDVEARADGDLLIFLNGDAEAEPGAVRAIVREANAATNPVFGVMARPVPPPGGEGPLYGALDLLWGIHDRLHRETYARGEGTHLSDEMFALPIDHLPPFPEGIITDGAFAAAWIRSQGGELRYAVEARVRLSLPASLGDHLEQRRRIHVGERQLALRGTPAAATLAGFARSDFTTALRLVRTEVRQRPGGVRSLLMLLGAEALASTLSHWDRLAGTVNDGIWRRVDLATLPGVGEPAAGTSAA